MSKLLYAFKASSGYFTDMSLNCLFCFQSHDLIFQIKIICALQLQKKNNYYFFRLTALNSTVTSFRYT